jgi:two-component system cell cycle sensor histidine kinase/response regulator CckA
LRQFKPKRMSKAKSGKRQSRKPGLRPRATRFPVQIPFRYRRVGEIEWTQGTTENMSCSGVLFRAQQLITPESGLEMQFMLPSALAGEASQEVACNGYVVRTVEPARPGEPPALASKLLDCIFIHPPDILSRMPGEIRRTEEALRFSEEKFTKAFRASPDAITITTVDEGRYIEVNDSFLRLSGYTREEVIGHTSLELNLWVDLADRVRLVEPLRRNQFIRDLEVCFRHRSGRTGLALVSADRIELGGQACLLTVTRDLTPQKQKEVEVQRQQDFLRKVLDANPNLVFVKDWDRKFTLANRAVAEIYGTTPEGLTGRTDADFNPDKEQVESFLRADREVMSTGTEKLIAAEPVTNTRTGEVRWFQTRKTPLFDGEGKATHVLGVSTDVSEHKRAAQLQAALYRIAETASSPADLQTMFAAIHAIVGGLMDARNFYIALYDPAAGLLSFPYFVDEEDVTPASKKLGKGLTEYVLRTGQPLLASPETFDDLVRRGEAETVGAPSLDWLGVPLKAGEQTFGVLVVQSYKENVRFSGPDKEILTFVSQQVANAIEHKRSEEALRRSEASYRSLIEGAAYGIYRSDIKGRLLEVNPALVEMLGYDSEAELLSRNLAADVYADPAERARLIAQHEKQDRFQGVEVNWKRKDGCVLAVRLTGRPVLDAQGVLEYFEGIVENVAERRALEDQLRQSQKMEAVGQLAGGIAHDFNNLLEVIMGYSDLLVESLPPENPHRRQAEEIYKAGKRAAGLTRQLLAFSRKQVLQPRVLDLNAIVTDLTKLLRRTIGEHIEFSARLSPVLARVKADPNQIEQILMNLAVNARDAMPQGGSLALETSNVTVDEAFAQQHTGLRPGDYVLLTVADTGSGMDLKVQARVFEPFFTTKEKGKGTGLGLATVYGIVKQSEGYIAVQSAPGQGTRFRIYLPRVEEPATPAPPQPEKPASITGSETILLVEDEDAVRRLARAFLENRGYTVLEARDGAHAIEICEDRGQIIHLMVTDVVMPKMGGRELAQRVAPIRPDMRVLFVSGYTGDSMVLPGAQAAFLEKPFGPGDLVKKVRQILDQKPS